MKKYHGWFLICDMDGTLLNSQREVSKKNKAALNEFVEQGGLFSVATGRDEVSLSKFLNDLPINLPVIVYNGAAIYDYSKKEFIWSRYLDRSVLPLIRELMVAFPDLGVEVYDESNVYVVKESQATRDQLLRDLFVPRHAPVDKIDFPWKKIILAWEPEKLSPVETYLRNKKVPFHFFYSQPDFIEILHPEASKGSALRELASMWEIPSDAIIAIGDHMNDLEMLQYAGKGIAVSNAHPLLKAAVGRCCGHHDCSAVAEVIQWLRDGFL